MKKKKLLAILMLTAMVVGSLAGCSNGGSTSKETTNESTQESTKESTKEEATTSETKEEASNTADSKWEYKEATLSFMVGNSASLAGVEAVAALAKEKLGITLEIENIVGGADGDNLLKTRLAAGDVTDIVVYNSGAKLMALNPSEYFIDISGEDFAKRLDDTYAKTVSSDGATYGIPQASSQAGAVLYSKPLYEKYNLEIPKTWDDFIKNCQVLKDAGETALIGTFADSWTTQLLFLGDNFNILAKEPTFPADFEAGKAKYSTSEAGLASFEKLAETKDFYNADYMAATYDDGTDMLANAEGGHWIMLTQALSNIYELYGDKVNDIGVFPIPSDDASNNGLTVWMPLSLYGNKSSDKQEDILRFMEFYVSDEGLDAYTSAVLPDGPYCIKGYELPEKSYQAVAEDMQPYFDAGKTAVALEFLTAVKGANLESICQEVVSGQATAEDAAKAYDADCLKQAVQLGLDWK